MAKLIWDQIGEKLYETGVKQGVLYVQDGAGTYPAGIAWNGLISVTESPSGAEATALYADDAKYLSLISAEQFGAKIEAYTYPEEFAICDGSVEIGDGVLIGQQSRTQFGLAYKTTLGNDTTGNDYGYKLHIIYGALAKPSEKGYTSINDSPEAITFSWEVTTTAVEVTGKKPTASIVFDSTKADPTTLAALELILFGGVATPARLPLPAEIVALFAGAAPSALALSSSVPAADATAVLVGANVVLTFNNKISSENIIVTTAAGALVAGTKTWDTAGKVLTFVPTGNMAASTVHLVVIGGVGDIYGQALATVVRKFTTA